jgi:malate synthase
MDRSASTRRHPSGNHSRHRAHRDDPIVLSRRDAEVNQLAFAKVREDKEREANDGFDGSWVAHPDLSPICQEIFDKHLGDSPNQLDAGG